MAWPIIENRIAIPPVNFLRFNMQEAKRTGMIPSVAVKRPILLSAVVML